MTPNVLWLASGYTALLLGKALGAIWQLRRERRRRPAMVDRSAATVLVPVLGGDPELGVVLAANATALAPTGILLLVDEDDAAGKQAAAPLPARFPHVRVHLCPPAVPSDNPKTHKLALALEMVATEFLVVLDDDARLEAASLDALLQALDDAELTTALPHYRSGCTLPQNLLAQFVNNNAALTYLPLLPFQAPVTVNGMAYALRTAVLRQHGGFGAIQKHLTDDLAIADLVRRHGGRITQLAAPVAMATTLNGFGHYVRQMHRWFVFALLLLRRQSAAMNGAILALHGLPPLLLWAILGTAAVGAPGALPALLAVLAVRAAVLMGLQVMLTGRPRHHLLLSPLSELLQPLHLLHASCVRTIRWRTRHYRVYDNDHFTAA